MKRRFLLLLGFLMALSHPALAGEFGANKFDLMLDYLTPSPAGESPEGYARVRKAMAQKAIADARDAGIPFFRVSVTGFAPSGFGGRSDLALWQSDAPAFWARMDGMFNDLDRAHIRLVPSFVWNISQFPALGSDTVGTFVRDPNSRSRQLLVAYITQFVTRYKTHDTILFYELGNEMNLLADLDQRKRNCKAATPCVWDNFSTADMIAFSRDMVSLFHSLDPGRKVTSGYSIPRPGAAHLAARPEYGTGGPDWTQDSPDLFRRYLLDVHAPFDIVSVHIYAGSDSVRFGRKPDQDYLLVADAAAAARSAGKPLFVGEYGDKGTGPFIGGLLGQMIRSQVEYSALWIWEFYQFSTRMTHESPADSFSIEPGYSDALIALLMKATGAQPPPPSPRVVLTWPLTCATLTQPVGLFAVASDGTRAVKSVEFRVDGALFATVSAAPYTVSFDPAKLGRRVARIEAKAITADGASASFASMVKLGDASLACKVDSQ